jgi:YhcH/YjgK/YiaL family protein
MIFDTLQNAGHYHGLSPRMAIALQFLASPAALKLALGRQPIDGDILFAIVQEYQTQPASERFWETHRKYIDVQFIQIGVERMGYAPAEQMKVMKPYDAAKEFTMLEGEGQFIQVPAGSFTIFMPHDAHMGGVAVGAESQLVRKIVIKVAVGG